MFRHIPNALTVLRLLLAIVFFTLLAFYQYEGRGDRALLYVALVIYVAALVTDFLDGYLARRWKVEGAFGRVVDPLVDKVLVLGSFAFFAGKNFIIPEFDPAQIGDPTFKVFTITGVAPAMVVVMLTRELLVTGLRGISESGGQSFGAVWTGKVKMAVQSVAILIILLYVNFFPKLGGNWLFAARIFRDIAIWTTIAITVYSGLVYIQKAISLYRAKRFT